MITACSSSITNTYASSNSFSDCQPPAADALVKSQSNSEISPSYDVKISAAAGYAQKESKGGAASDVDAVSYVAGGLSYFGGLFITIAVCNWASSELSNGPALCSVASPASIPLTFPFSDLLDPLKGIGVVALGAYAGTQVLQNVGNAQVRSAPTTYASAAIVGAAAALACVNEYMYHSQASSSTEERAPMVHTEA